MSVMSTYLGNKVLDHVFGTSAFTMPTAIYLSLHTADPGLTGTSEVSGGGYARQLVTMDAAASKATQVDGAESFSAVGADFGLVTHAGYWDAVSGGNFFIGEALAASKTVVDGDTIEYADGELDVSVT